MVDAESPPTVARIPAALAAQLLALYTLDQLTLLVQHTEAVQSYGGHGDIVLAWREGRLYTVAHQVSEKV